MTVSFSFQRLRPVYDELLFQDLISLSDLQDLLLCLVAMLTEVLAVLLEGLYTLLKDLVVLCGCVVA